jgi:hypothetical protein
MGEIDLLGMAVAAVVLGSMSKYGRSGIVRGADDG